MTTPTCPACGSTDLRHEADDRHQCRKCLWRCVVAPNGSTRDWLSIGAAGKWGGRIKVLLATPRRAGNSTTRAFRL